MSSDILDGSILALSEAVIFHISVLSEDGKPTGLMVAGGDNEARSVCVYGDQFYPALCEIDLALDQYQETNPQRTIIEICSDEVIEIMNLLLETRGLKPVSEDRFNFSDVLLWIGNPVLARQMGYGLH